MSSNLDITIHSIQPVLSHHQIEKLEHEDADLGSAASSHYARCLCFMPHLRSLKLDSVKLSDEFYSTMASEASKAKVYLNTICIGNNIFPQLFCNLQTEHIWINVFPHLKKKYKSIYYH